MDSHCRLFFQILNAGNIKYIILLQRNVRNHTFQQAFQIYGNNLARQILMFTIDYGTI